MKKSELIEKLNAIEGDSELYVEMGESIGVLVDCTPMDFTNLGQGTKTTVIALEAQERPNAKAVTMRSISFPV